MKTAGLALILSLAAGAALGFVSDRPLDDPAAEARARDIMAELRCLVCQNESIDESGAELARDLRAIVRERVALGETDAAVRAYLVTRYGDWILLSPPVKPRTLPLWLAPAVILAGALAGASLWHRGRRRADPPAPLTPAEQDRLDQLVRDKGEDA